MTELSDSVILDRAKRPRNVSTTIDHLVDVVRTNQERFHGERYWDRARETPSGRLVDGEAAMVTLRGQSQPFRCSCGANVFTKLSVWDGKTGTFYRCNGCQTIYEGE